MRKMMIEKPSLSYPPTYLSQKLQLQSMSSLQQCPKIVLLTADILAVGFELFFLFEESLRLSLKENVRRRVKNGGNRVSRRTF